MTQRRHSSPLTPRYRTRAGECTPGCRATAAGEARARPAERPTERPVERPAERPVERPVERPAERPAEERPEQQRPEVPEQLVGPAGAG